MTEMGAMAVATSGEFIAKSREIKRQNKRVHLIGDVPCSDARQPASATAIC